VVFPVPWSEALNLQIISPEDVEVELKPHKGFQMTAIGQVEVTLPQKVVFINGKWAGYVGDEPGARINLIVEGLPQELVDVIKAKVDALKAGIPSVAITQVKTIQQNDVALVREDEPEDEEDSLEDEDI